MKTIKRQNLELGAAELAEVERRFFEGIEFSGECWVWVKARMPKGYGKMSVLGKTIYAHRVAWTIFHGSIPGKRVLDHTCRNKPCCNPSHLEPVTQRRNIQRIFTIDGQRRGRQRPGSLAAVPDAHGKVNGVAALFTTKPKIKKHADPPKDEPETTFRLLG